MCRNLTGDARARGHARAATVRKARADGFATDIVPLAAELAAIGRSLRQIAATLNDQGYETAPRQALDCRRCQPGPGTGRSVTGRCGCDGVNSTLTPLAKPRCSRFAAATGRVRRG